MRRHYVIAAMSAVQIVVMMYKGDRVMERFTKREIKKHIVDTLREWSNGDGIPDEEAGLCYNFARHVTDTFALRTVHLCRFMTDATKRWPKFSGDEDYPVPVPPTARDHLPRWLYDTTVHKWGDDDYSELRRELCDFIADEFEAVEI